MQNPLRLSRRTDAGANGLGKGVGDHIPQPGPFRRILAPWQKVRDAHGIRARKRTRTRLRFEEVEVIHQ